MLDPYAPILRQYVADLDKQVKSDIQKLSIKAQNTSSLNKEVVLTMSIAFLQSGVGDKERLLQEVQNIRMSFFGLQQPVF